MIKNKYVIILKNDAAGDLTKSLHAINNIINNNKDLLKDLKSTDGEVLFLIILLVKVNLH